MSVASGDRRAPVLVGIMGDSGSGKSTLAAGVAAALGAERVATLCLDDYHRFGREERRRRGLTALDPACNDLELMADHLRRLRRGERVLKPVYDHRDGTVRPPVAFAPRAIVVVYGLVGLVTPELAGLYDLAVFLDPDPDLRVQWKMQRDCSHRGYSPEQVREQLAERRGDAERYVLPQRERADLVLQFYPQPGYWSDRDDARLDLRLVRRRALAGPDLAALCAEAERLGGPEGARRPFVALDDATDPPSGVVLEVDGAIPERVAIGLEEWLWGSLPDAPRARPSELGTFTDSGPARHSHTLALAQLLVAAHVAAAAAARRGAERSLVGA